jgi:hypothetical protein
LPLFDSPKLGRAFDVARERLADAILIRLRPLLRSRFRQPKCDRLLGRPGSVFAFAHVLNFLANELARLRGRRFALRCIAMSTLDDVFFWHGEVLSIRGGFGEQALLSKAQAG